MKLHTIFSLLMLASKFPDGITGGEGKVNCGNHHAASCSACPQGNGEGWCNGECVWQNSRCVSKSVSCGGHRAASCSECPKANRGRVVSWWCNGECEWQSSTCVLKAGDASHDKASLDDYRKMQLKKHNKFRATHKSPSMSLDYRLNKDAQAHAEKLARQGKWLSKKDHASYGENLSLSCHSRSPPDHNDATDDWYAEEKNWDYWTGDKKQICKQNPNSCVAKGATGHFTQVVWKGSVKLGIGKATGKVDDWFCTWVVGRYSPVGNVQGQYRNNVLRP